MRTRIGGSAALALVATLVALPAAAQGRGAHRTPPGGTSRGESHVAGPTGGRAVPRGESSRPMGSYGGAQSASRGSYVSPSVPARSYGGARYGGAPGTPRNQSYGPPPATAYGGVRARATAPSYGDGARYDGRAPAYVDRGRGGTSAGHYAVPRTPAYGGGDRGPYNGSSYGRSYDGGYYGGRYSHSYYGGSSRWWGTSPRYGGGYRRYGYYGGVRPFYGGFVGYYPGFYPRPYYAFRPWFSVGFGISVGYPVAFPVGFSVGGPFGMPYGAAVGVVPGPMAYGGISFEIDPPFAAIIIDGTYIGDAGNFGPTARPVTVMAGRHRVEIRADGFQPVVFDLDVLPGQVIPYRGAMVPF